MMDFSAALRLLKSGNAMTRQGWNGKGMFICLMPELKLPPYNTQGTERKVNDRTAKWIGEDQPLNCRPYIAMYTAKKEWQPGWLASQADLLAEDWIVFGVGKAAADDIAANQPRGEGMGAGGEGGRASGGGGACEIPDEPGSGPTGLVGKFFNRGEQKPSIGRIVRYRSNGKAELGTDGQDEHPAIITGVYDDKQGGVELTVFVRGSIPHTIRRSTFGGARGPVLPGEWFWPPRD